MANTYTQLGVDNGQRTNESPISDGGNWVTASGFGVVRLLAHLIGPSADFAIDCSTFSGVISSWPADQYCEVVVGGDMSFNWPALRVSTSFYTLEVISGSQWWIVIRPANTIIKVGTAKTLSNGDVLRIEAQGTTISTYYNGVFNCSTVNAALASGPPGVAGYAAGVPAMSQWDGGSIYAGNVSSIGLVPSSVTYPTTSTGTVTLDTAAPTGGIVVTLSSSDTTVATVPASVTVLAGQTTATFTVTPLDKTGTSNITGTIGGGSSAFATLTVTHYLVATPTFSPVAGTYTSTQSVTISSTDSALTGFAITYTVDGTTPVPGSHGTVYSGAVSVAATQTIKAIASATGYLNSTEADALYTIAPAGGEPPIFASGAGFSTRIDSPSTSPMGTNLGTTILG